MHAPLTEVAVQGRPGVAGVSELLVQPAQVAQVVPEPVDGDRGVLPALEGVGPVRHVRGRAEPGLADLPQLLLVLGVVEERDVGVVLGPADGFSSACACWSASSVSSPPNCTIRNPVPSGSSSSASAFMPLICSSWIS